MIELGFEEHLQQVRDETDQVLAGLPDNKLEARREITRALGIDPSPEELQTIVKVAHEPPPSEIFRELAYTALAVRVLAHRELRELLDARGLDSARLGLAARLIPQLRRIANTLEREIDRNVEMLREQERDYLLRVGDSLIPSIDTLQAAEVLAPRLVEFASECASGDPRRSIPSLSDEEAELIASALRPSGASCGDASRIRLNALALRTVINDDLDAWEGVSDEGVEVEAERQRILERLERDVTAYQVVSERLQQQQDTALVADLRDMADELRRAKQGLFSCYLKVSSVLKAGASGTDAPGVERLLDACAAADVTAEAERGRRVTREELYLDALNDVRKPAAEPAPELELTDPRTEKLRRTVLTVAAVVAGVLCVLAYVFLLPGGAANLELSPSELPPRLVPTRVVAIGSMLYAQVNSWIWEDLDDAQRVQRINEIGDSARMRGYETVYVTDENNRDLARWTVEEGAVLAGAGAESKRN
jgi:hypothetical protein